MQRLRGIRLSNGSGVLRNSHYVAELVRLLAWITSMALAMIIWRAAAR